MSDTTMYVVSTLERGEDYILQGVYDNLPDATHCVMMCLKESLYMTYEDITHEYKRWSDIEHYEGLWAMVDQWSTQELLCDKPYLIYLHKATLNKIPW